MALLLCPEEVKTLICVYPADCSDFSGNGLGVVQPQSCTVTETLVLSRVMRKIGLQTPAE